MLAPDAIAEASWQLHQQHPSAWPQELDLRPAPEKFQAAASGLAAHPPPKVG